MTKSEQKVVQYLNEAHASETSLIAVLQSQIAITPRGSYRDALEQHLGETREHARRVRERAGELGLSSNPLQAMIGLTETVIGQSLAFSKVPLDLLRGTGGEEKVLKNAKDAAATEALEIATYTALEQLAKRVSDERTARLAASIRADEERMLKRIMGELPKLADAVVGADVEGKPSYDPAQTGGADAVRKTARQATRQAKRTTGRAQSAARRTARQARRPAAASQAAGLVRGTVASEQDLPLPRYDSLTAEEIVHRLPELSQVQLATVESYERGHQDRSTVLERVSSLRGSEPWPGYDEQNASEIESALRDADQERARAVAAYEGSHKNRAGVLRAARRDAAKA